jgi:phosphoglycolate phosphatase-like HAD superfamily hydrolase
MVGIRETLEVLEASELVTLGLLTGNIAQGAMIKLGAFSLDRYFTIGAFGDDDEDRNRLLPVAVEKLRERTSLSVSYRDCVVIGDTPKDVECSKPYGAYSIAVATGPYSYAELDRTEADVVFYDFSDAGDFLDVLGMK